TCSRSWARRSFVQTSTSATLPTSYRKFVASSMFALSRAARASLARRIASTARRRASNLDVPGAVMSGTLRRAGPDVPPPQPHSPSTSFFVAAPTAPPPLAHQPCSPSPRRRRTAYSAPSLTAPFHCPTTDHTPLALRKPGCLRLF